MAKGKWANGIVPRNFFWILKERLAVCERPGGYGANHRRVRRKEEILWLRANGFTRVISLIPSTHNLHNYDEFELEWLHRPFPAEDEATALMPELYPELHGLLDQGERLLIHGDELGDQISGLLAGYLVWAGLLPTGPQAISIMERMIDNQMGPRGREMVTVAIDLRESGPPPGGAS